MQMQVEASLRDAFTGTVIQTGTLPAVFAYGRRRTLLHVCGQCAHEVAVEFASGKQILASGRLSRQGFQEHRGWLDAVGTLFGQYLRREVDQNGFESYVYLTCADADKGVLLNAAYYRCGHCQAQYLVAYQLQLQDNRPPFEPDKILLVKLLQVALNHTEFMAALRPVAAGNAAAAPQNAPRH